MGVLDLAVLRKELRDFKDEHGPNDGDNVWLEAVEDEIRKRSGNNVTARARNIIEGADPTNEDLSDQAGATEPWSDAAKEAEFIAVNGGSSGQLRSPEQAAEDRKKALGEVRYQVEAALQEFGKVTKQSHIVDRLLVCLTPTASMPDRLPFTPSASLHLASRNRDDHILHLAGLIIESWGVAMRYGTPGALGSVYELQASVVLLVDIVRDRRLFKVYPVDPRSSLFTLRRITDQAKLNKEAAAVEAERDERLGDFPTQ